MAVAIGDVLRVAAVQKYNVVNDVVNVFHFGVNAVPTPNTDGAVLADLAEVIGGAFTSLEANLTNGVQADHLSVFNVTQDAPIGIGSWGGTYTGGTGTGEGMPAHDCMLVLLSTAIKRKIGRIYLGVFTEASQNSGNWGGTIKANAAALVDTLINGDPTTRGGEYVLTVYSRGSGIPTPITTVRVQDAVAIQSRRKPGRGS